MATRETTKTTRAPRTVKAETPETVQAQLDKLAKQLANKDKIILGLKETITSMEQEIKKFKYENAQEKDLMDIIEENNKMQVQLQELLKKEIELHMEIEEPRLMVECIEEREETVKKDGIIKKLFYKEKNIEQNLY